MKAPKPENFKIPQTVTSPIERREIRGNNGDVYDFMLFVGDWM